MTTETRTTIKPSDIAAVELECVTCHFRAIRLISDWRQDSYTCANCGKNWMIDGSSDVKNLQMLVSLLRGLSDLNSGSSGHPFVIRFELARQG